MEGIEGFDRNQLIYENESQDVLVYKVFQPLANRLVAIKEFICPDLDILSRVMCEAENQKNLVIPSIVKIYSTYCWEDSDIWHFAIEMEWLESDLFSLKEAKFTWTELQFERFLWDIGSALAYMESRGIAHRDIKPHNLFLAGNRFKLGDFGFSKRINPDNSLNTIEVGTFFYHSKTLRNAYISYKKNGGDPYYPYDPYKEDVFSLAVTALSMLVPDLENREIESFERFLDDEVKVSMRRELRETMKVMLNEEAETRPDSLQVKDRLARIYQEAYGARVRELISSINKQIQEEGNERAMYDILEELLQYPMDLSVHIQPITCLACGKPVFPIPETCKIHTFCSSPCYLYKCRELGLNSASTSCPVCSSITKDWDQCQRCQEEMAVVPADRSNKRVTSLPFRGPDSPRFERKLSLKPDPGSTPYIHAWRIPSIVCMVCNTSFSLNQEESWRAQQLYRNPANGQICSETCYRKGMIPSKPQPAARKCSKCDEVLRRNSYLFHCKTHHYCVPSCTNSFSTIMDHWKVCNLCQKNLKVTSLPFRGDLRAAVFQGFEEFVFVYSTQVTASTKAMLPVSVSNDIKTAKCHVCRKGFNFSQSWYLLICGQARNYACSQPCLRVACPKSRKSPCSICGETVRNDPYLDLSDGKNARKWMGADLSLHCRLCYLCPGEVFLPCGHRFCQGCLIDFLKRRSGTDFHCVVCGFSAQVSNMADITSL